MLTSRDVSSSDSALYPSLRSVLGALPESKERGDVGVNGEGDVGDVGICERRSEKDVGETNGVEDLLLSDSNDFFD